MALAPMADVTDAAFRRIIAKYGKPDVMFTEFVSADGLCHEVARKKLLKDLLYSESERPIVAQLFTSHPDKMREAAAFVAELGFDGLDINMGCPDRSVEKQGAGAALMKDSRRAREIIRAAKEGAGNLPVSVKTRLGYNRNEIETWLPELLAEELAVITIHARTRKEMSNVPAQWEEVRRAVEMRDALKSQTLIFGNGDVWDLEDAQAKARETGANGIMLGRAVFGNPWLFAGAPRPNLGSGERFDLFLVKEKLAVMLEHTKLFEKLFRGIKNFAIMKKHYKAYVNGFNGAKELRVQLMEANDVSNVEKIITDFLKTSH